MEFIYGFCLGVAMGLLLGYVIIPFTVDLYVHERRRRG